MMEFTLQPVGIIRTPFTEAAQTPIQASRSTATGRVIIYPDFAAGLQDIEGLSHLVLLYVFDRVENYQLTVKPFLDDKLHGVFATRYPFRPNRIGMSTVHLLRREGNELVVEGVDMFDNTPLIDIKPYVPEFDVRTDVKIGWYENRNGQD